MFYVTETWNGSLLYTLHDIRVVYTTSVICPVMEALKTGVDAWNKFTILILVYNFSFFFMLDAAYTPCWFTFLFCGKYSSWKVVFCYPLEGVVTIMVN